MRVSLVQLVQNGVRQDVAALRALVAEDAVEEQVKGGAVVPAEEPKVWSETVVARLAELREEVYDGWDPEGLAAALKPHGVSTIQVGRRVKGKVVNRRGIDRSHIVAAIAERDGKRDAG